MAKPDLMEFLAQQARLDSDDNETPKIAADIEAVKLRASLAAYQRRHEFRVGDIVRQKPDAKIYKRYGQNDIGIVVELLDEPVVIDNGEQGSPYFRMKQDILIACIEGDSFCVFHVDSRRFEPVPDDVMRLVAAQANAA
jgi:hypothetical protein